MATNKKNSSNMGNDMNMNRQQQGDLNSDKANKVNQSGQQGRDIDMNNQKSGSQTGKDTSQNISKNSQSDV